VRPAVIDTAHVKLMLFLFEPFWCEANMECTKMDFRFVGKAAQLTPLLNNSK